MKSLFQKYVSLGHHHSDSDDEKLKKSSLLVMSGPFSMAGIVWGLLYFSAGLNIPGSIPFSYGLLSIVNIISLGYTKKYKFFRNSQLFLILILPFCLQVSLGGFVPSSAVMYWAIIAPAGAMFFDSIRRSLYWFGAYLFLVCMAYLINDLIPGYVQWNLSQAFIDALFLMNIIGVSCIVFAILYYFVGKITVLKKDIENKNEELQIQSIKLKELDKLKSRFFANISHEFRTPLTIILGIINKQIANPDSPPDYKDSDTMKRNALQLLQLINQLLDLSKLESGEMRVESSEGDLLSFARNLTLQFESLASVRQIEITFNGHPLSEHRSFRPIAAQFDKEKLQKILTNLLSNAVKFTPDSGKIAVEIKTAKSQAKKEITIAISNTGAGIPKEKLPFVFNRFYQVDDAINRKYEGTGIGLALVKELTELLQGSILAESKDGLTEFTVSLPFLDSNGKPEDDRMTESLNTEVHEPLKGVMYKIPDEISTHGSETTDKLEILIVEDNQDLRNFIKGILDTEYSVEEAVDGLNGLERAQLRIPDLIISDVMMPNMDGYDLCKRLKQSDKTNHIPVILLTARAARENKLEGLEAGADDYLIKPFDEEELKIRVRNLIQIREKLQKKYQRESILRPRNIEAVSVHQKFLEQLKEVVEKNIDNEQFSVEDLGKFIGMSRSQIHRKLKALTNQSASNFIRDYRLHRAADLLRQNAGNVSEIAYRVGFSSQTYFSSSFSNLFGFSPSEFKQRLTNPVN